MILRGWKEIAAHLGRHPDTLRRWKKAGLNPPVRYLHGRVFAYSDEIDTWLKRSSSPRNEQAKK